MAETNVSRKKLMEEIVNRKKIGNKRFHSETSLQHFDEDEDAASSDNTHKDPGVLNTTMNDLEVPSLEEAETLARRRTKSQPGPVSGSMVTATAARATRRRPMRSVNYPSNLEMDTDKQTPQLTIPRMDDSFMGDRSTPLPYNGSYRNLDSKSLNSFRGDLRGGMTPRDAQSIRSVDTQGPPPTSPEDKKRLSMQYLTVICSCMYAILLVTMGIIIYLSDPFVGAGASTIYSIILSAMGFIYHLYLIIDIQRYKSIALKNQKIKSHHEDRISDFFRKQEMEYGNNFQIEENLRTTVLPSPVLIPNTHNYCFSHGRHSGSFYLKLGAAGFAFGHLVHSILLIAVQIGYFFDDQVDNQDCANIAQIVLDVFNPLYSFFQLYFIFKYSNVIILRGQGLARFAFMHLIGSSLCFWVSAIVRETMLALTLYAQSRYGGENATEYYSRSEDPLALKVVKILDIDISGLYDERCTGSAAITSIFENFSPYLYPFSVEFNILIVAVYYIIWNNVGNCSNISDDSISIDDNDNTTVCKIPTANEDNDYTSNLVIHADCHASNRGLFLGLVVMVIMIGMLIIGFVFNSVDPEYLEIGYLLNDSTKLGLHAAMLLASVVAFNQTRKLDINEHPISLLDDILLFICLPAFFMETALSLVATINIPNIVKTIDIVVMVIQVIIQTPLLIDGLRRCSNSRKLRRTKPGRELLMFLLIANVAMWIFNTFSYKSSESLDVRYVFYGKVLWTILGHVSLPLIMFYRFHSSVCFADMWDSAYKPGSEH